jgi:hypothetical protein
MTFGEAAPSIAGGLVRLIRSFVAATDAYRDDAHIPIRPSTGTYAADRSPVSLPSQQ